MNKLTCSVLSMAIGVSITWMFLQPSFANEMIKPVLRSEVGAKCAAKLGPARFTVGDRCFRDEVMVGRWDDNIYCANIEIICN